ncbi:FAD binding domain-containing protein [Pendulispora brunnea]|uniref:FAD binding domain-containing protein n=1 Tax=Pendulispora brunnea TaxID=2905690 RepID=A0ABZ2KBJ8_9BACT
MLQSTAKLPRAAHAPAGLEATELIRPKTAVEAVKALAEAAANHRSTMVLAGGTDVIVDRHLLPVDRAHAVDLVVDVTRIEGFRTIEREFSVDRDRLVFAGGVTYWDLRQDPLVLQKIPMLAEMSKDVGAVQIQTRGTLAGNIATASPAADGVAALMALDANVHLLSAPKVGGSAKGEERIVPLTQFFTGYRKTVMRAEELIVRMDVRVPDPATASVIWRKVGTRQAQSISKVALASVIEVQDGTIRHARFGMASVAATTHPLSQVQAYLEGRALASVKADEVDAALARDIRPIDDVRSTGEYRMHVARSVVRRALSQAK